MQLYSGNEMQLNAQPQQQQQKQAQLQFPQLQSIAGAPIRDVAPVGVPVLPALPFSAPPAYMPPIPTYPNPFAYAAPAEIPALVPPPTTVNYTGVLINDTRLFPYQLPQQQPQYFFPPMPSPLPVLPPPIGMFADFVRRLEKINFIF